MRFDCGETYKEKVERLKIPHKWFAWYPVWVASHDCRWLENVERTCRPGYEMRGYGWDKEYKAIKEELT